MCEGLGELRRAVYEPLGELFFKDPADGEGRSFSPLTLDKHASSLQGRAGQTCPEPDSVPAPDVCPRPGLVRQEAPPWGSEISKVGPVGRRGPVMGLVPGKERTPARRLCTRGGSSCEQGGASSGDANLQNCDGRTPGGSPNRSPVWASPCPHFWLHNHSFSWTFSNLFNEIYIVLV